MKKILLSFFAFALSAVAAQAQSWTEPTLKLTTDAVPEKAYIYNVEQAKFLTKGGAWGNHASIKADVSTAFLYEMQDQGDGSYKLHCSAAANNGYLGRESVEDVYTDWKAQTTWGLQWSFLPVEGGFNIRSAATDPNFGDEKYAELDLENNQNIFILGWNAERDDLTNGNGEPMGTNDGVYMVDPEMAADWSCTWAFMTEEDYAVYNVQWSLYDKLNAALEMGYTEAELSQYAAALAGTDIDAINEATTQVGELILNYAYNHASPENPYDVTSKIANPTFEGARNAEPAGWVDEFGNMLIQNNKAYPVWDEDNNVESGEYGLNNFSQNWTASATDPIAQSNIYQVISELPQGTYILQADAIATSASSSLLVSGAELYAESGAAHYAVAIDKNTYGEAGSGSPHRYQLLVTHMGGDLKIGYGFTPGYVKWFAVDNFKLFYAGPVDNPGLVALESAIEAAKTYVDEYAEEDIYYYSEETKEALAAELEKAEGLKSASSEECLAEAGAINDLLKAAKAEVTAYAKLIKFAEQVGKDVDKYPFIEELGDKYDEYKGAYEDKTATIEGINAWIDGYAAYIVEGVKKALPTATDENPIEVTGLFANLGFEENTAESATPNNWTCNSTAFKVRVNTAEVWNTTFDAYTTLSDLPAGAYRITAHGLSRSGDSVSNFGEEGANVTAEFYANGAAVKVKSQHLGAGAEQLYTNDVNLTNDEENPLWAPNSMEGARRYFNVEGTPYVNTVVANLLNDGDPLRIGFRDNGTDGAVVENSWTIWSDVRVYYIGVSNNALYEEMQLVAAKVNDILNNASDVEMVLQSSSLLNEAAAAAEATTVDDSEEKIVAVIAQMNNAIAYYEQGIVLANKIIDEVAVYDEIVSKYDASDNTELTQLLDVIEAATSEEVFESNEQIEGWLAALPAARTAHIFAAVLAEAEAAPSEETPLDVTDVMSNASFESNNANGWTITNTGGSIGGSDAQRTSSTAYEMWNGTAFDIHQTVVGLKEGYYRLSAKALFRNGNNSDDLAAQYFAAPDSIKGLAQFYANDKAVAVKSIYDDAQTEDPAINGQGSYVVDGQTFFTPNTMISFEAFAVELGLYSNEIDIYLDGKTDLTIGLRYETTASYAWFPFDEFKVSYLGTTAPTAIKDVTAASQGVASIFNLNGQQQSRLQKGVNIVRTADGRVLKLMVK